MHGTQTHTHTERECVCSRVREGEKESALYTTHFVQDATDDDDKHESPRRYAKEVLDFLTKAGYSYCP